MSANLKENMVRTTNEQFLGLRQLAYIRNVTGENTSARIYADRQRENSRSKKIRIDSE